MPGEWLLPLRSQVPVAWTPSPRPAELWGSRGSSPGAAASRCPASHSEPEEGNSLASGAQSRESVGVAWRSRSRGARPGTEREQGGAASGPRASWTPRPPSPGGACHSPASIRPWTPGLARAQGDVAAVAAPWEPYYFSDANTEEVAVVPSCPGRWSHQRPRCYVIEGR